MKMFDVTVLSHDLDVHKRHAFEIQRDSLSSPSNCAFRSASCSD
jgi:hypothetical protein